MERNGGFLVLRRTRAWHEVDGVFSMHRVSYVGREKGISTLPSVFRHHTATEKRKSEPLTTVVGAFAAF